jgi:Rha family phage regulatory protein
LINSTGKQWTTSLNIAEVFGIAHKNIIQAIENLDCSQEFARLNFQPGKYADKNNQMRKMYEITRDGFTFLVMGFTRILADECSAVRLC